MLKSRSTSTKTRITDIQDENIRKFTNLPYAQRISEKLRLILIFHRITLVKPKDCVTNEQKNPFGASKRSINSRFNEHRRSVEN